MGLDLFLESLFDSGRVRVPPPAEIDADDKAAAANRLATIERTVRADFPGVAPAWNEAAGLWGAEMLYHACQFATYRDFGPAALAQVLGANGPGDNKAETTYSVDVTFQYLPDLHRLTRQAAPGDPLVAQVVAWANDWPLSSVGIASVALKAPSVDVVLDHPGLRQRYVDRILTRGDAARCQDPRVREAVLETLGIHPQLAGELTKLFALDQTRGVTE